MPMKPSTSISIAGKCYLIISLTTTLQNCLRYIPEASFTFVLQRRAYYYSFLIIIPSFIMTFLCVVGLFWTSFDYERCLEKITDLSIPRTTQMPILSTFILCNLLLVSFATLVVLVMSKLSTYIWYIRFEKRYRSSVPRLFSPRLLCLFFFTSLSIVNAVFFYA